MTDVSIGQVWEVYSPQERQWSRAVVAKMEDGAVVLRYEGMLELLAVTAAELHSNPERFRLVTVVDC